MKPNFTKLIQKMNQWADEELNTKSPKLVCSTGRHTSNLRSTKVGDKCIDGIWELAK